MTAVTSTFCCCLERRGDERGILDLEQTSIRRILGCIRQHKGIHPKEGRDLEDDGAVAVDDDHQEGMDGCSRRIDSVRDHHIRHMHHGGL